MKLSITGPAELIDGVITITFIAEAGAQSKALKLPLTFNNTPSGDREMGMFAMTSGEPYQIHEMGGSESEFWLYRGKTIHASGMLHLSEEEKKLEVINLVLKHEKRYKQIQRQFEAYARIEQTDAAQRERIPENVRLFVWQRDEGKCVKCGTTEKLEFDHIIPVAKGGSNTERNIQLLCEVCNRAKGVSL